MAKFIELKIKDPKNIYQELTQVLCPYRNKPAGTMLFVVESTIKNPIIGLRYPGRKLRKRTLKKPNKNSALWANLYDFEVVPFRNGNEVSTKEFTLENMVNDFQEKKKNNEKFWIQIEEIYQNNNITQEPPNLPGIEPKLYLLMLKWIWIQEDFNYRLNWQEVNSPIKYVLETRTGSRTAKGAGRAKSFAALILLKHHSNLFTFEQVKKIIPSY